MNKAGKVFLIGCGVGAGALSKDAVSVLKKCDCVLYDRLIDDAVLRLARGKLIFVGKKPGQSGKQGEINLLLLSLARKGKAVCRLKGGDAFLFSRGVEEKRFLESRGIAVEVISGQSALNALSSEGMPVTARGFSSSVSILTGVEKGGRKPKNFKGLDADCVVFFMALQNLQNIVSALLEKRPKGAPCVFVENAGRHNCRKIFCTLENAFSTCRDARVESPALFVVGNCVALAMPALAGRCVLSFREKNGHNETESFLRSRGAFPLNVPVFSIKHRVLRVAPSGAKIFAFTSPNAVRSACLQLELKGKFVAIGSVTASELAKFGHKALVPKLQSALGLQEFLKQFPKDDVAVFCSPKTSVKGFKKIYAYDANYSCGEAVLRRAIRGAGVVFFTSPEILGFVVGKVGAKAFGKKEVWAVGPATARKAKALGLRVDCALPFPELKKSFGEFFR